MASSNVVGDEQPNQLQCCPSGTNDSSDSNGDVPVRTVYIDGFEPHWLGEINRDFGRFGEIESVAERFEDPWTQYCLVQFKREEDAMEALLRTGNKWNGCDVKAADPWHQPDHPLQVAPEQDSDLNISIALNDDCLQEIFKFLKLRDLTNVAGVCERFNAEAKIIFALKYKHLSLDHQFHQRQGLLETAMKHFGKDIKSLSINASLFSNETDAYDMIRQNCGPQLKRLELALFQFQTDLRSLRPIFSQIEQLDLIACDKISELGELMAGCGELKSLSLSFCVVGDDQNIFSRTFPKLQEFSLSCDELNDEIVVGFVIRHPALIKLSIENVQLTPRLFRTIGQHAKNLQELRIFERYDHRRRDNHFQNDAEYIGQLSSMKKVQLYLQNSSIVPSLKALVAGEAPIESMEIDFDRQSDIDQAIKCISQLKRIKVLQLRTDEDTRRVTDEDVIALAKCLPELEELHLDEIRSCLSDLGFKSELSTIGLRKMLMHAHKLKLLKLHWIHSINIDVDDYKAMLRMVQKRNEKVPLVIEIYGKRNQIDVPAAVLAENRSIFNIKLFQLTLFGLFPINLI